MIYCEHLRRSPIDEERICSPTPSRPSSAESPTFFFGRETTLNRFRRALIDRGSEDRALFITGTRGSGKTTLVEQLSQRASSRGWHTVDLGAEHLSQTFLRRLLPYDDETKTLSPQAGISVSGVDGSLSAGSVSKTVKDTTEDLQSVFLDACEKHPKGIFVSVDEVQKVPLDEVSALCEAFQLASRKGHNAILVLAGLPHAYASIIHHEGCTFMRRGVREHIGLFTFEDTISAFKEAFSTIDDLKVAEPQIRQLT